MKTICVYNSKDMASFPTGLENFKIWLAGKEAEIPQEFRHTADIDICTEHAYGDDYAVLTIEYVRPFNEEEKEEERLRMERNKSNRLAALKRELELLEKGK